jgi:hypothetical protein
VQVILNTERMLHLFRQGEYPAHPHPQESDPPAVLLA